ncbi:MAG TPA: hypothetical protein VN682_04735 [Terriglobales bacterium]|nr:hypothetical protein [Terriglobales bacterium]
MKSNGSPANAQSERTGFRGRKYAPGFLAAAAAVLLVLLIYAGSRGFRDFDPALIGYAVATVFAVAAIVYRYTVWIVRPPTWRYFKAGWVNFLSTKNFRRYTALVPTAWWRDIFGQTFLLNRSFERWLMHMCISWGVILSCLITFPLTFGWFRFTLVGADHYRMWFFGFPLFQFAIQGFLGFCIFHGLDFTAILLMAGLGIALKRRLEDVGLRTTQRFGFDLVPLVLLFAIAITGLALTASAAWWQGRYYWFISLTHQLLVVAWLLSLPFGKFFHIFQRPASIGVTLYQTVNQGLEQAPGDVPSADVSPAQCKRCHRQLPSKQFIDDLKATLGELGQRYELGDQDLLQDFCPTCKRILRGQAYYTAAGNKLI